MSDAPWLSIIGLGEDGLNGLTPASRNALEQAEVVMGPPRHLGLIGDTPQDRVAWPVPFADGLPVLEAMRGRKVAVLASGDPFWFGAGSVIARHLTPGEWRAYPGPSTAALACAHLGWAQERTPSFGLHAAPFERLIPALAPGARIVVLLRDGEAPAALAAWLAARGWGASTLHVMEALGGPNERIRSAVADGFALRDIRHPVCAALEVAGDGSALPVTPGRSEDWFDHDGQITKSPVRALTLAALAPRPGESLWDLGTGSGSVAIEWLLSHPHMQAVGVERDPVRAARARANAARLGVPHLEVREGTALEVLADLPQPHAVFVGGGLDEDLLTALWTRLPAGCRLVANAVTLETDALLTGAAARHGGSLTRIEIAQAQPLGRVRGWKAAYPITQWSVTR